MNGFKKWLRTTKNSIDKFENISDQIIKRRHFTYCFGIQLLNTVPHLVIIFTRLKVRRLVGETNSKHINLCKRMKCILCAGEMTVLKSTDSQNQWKVVFTNESGTYRPPMKDVDNMLTRMAEHGSWSKSKDQRGFSSSTYGITAANTTGQSTAI